METLLAPHTNPTFTWIKSKKPSLHVKPAPAAAFSQATAAQERQEASSLLSTDCFCNPSSKSGATQEKQRRKPHGIRAVLGAPRYTPRCHLAQGRTTSAGCKWPNTLRGARKETDLLPPLVFCTQGNLYSWSDTGRWPRVGRRKTLLKRLKSTKRAMKWGKCPGLPGDCSGRSHGVTPHMNMSS